MRRAIVVGTVMLASVMSTWIFVGVDAASHSVSDTFYGSVVPIALVWTAAAAVAVVATRTMRGR